MKTNNKLNIIICLFILLISPTSLFAGGGDDHSHGDKPAATTHADAPYFSSEASSDKYEALIRYEPIHEKEEVILILFLSDYRSNKAIDKAQIKVSSPEDASMQFTVKQNSEGSYEIRCVFKEKKKYSLVLDINSDRGADLLLVQNIDVGKELEILLTTEAAEKSFPIWLIILITLLVGVAIGFIFKKNSASKGKSMASILFLIVYCMIPVTSSNAHGDDDHGANSSGNIFSNSFTIPKETQFLFDVFTEKVEIGNFTESSKLFGTIIPSSNGQALVSVPQNGKVISLHVKVGQAVKAGQLLAVIDQNLDASATVNQLTEKNNLAAERERAKKDYDRLLSIQDIAAKRDVDEAKARFQRAEANYKLLSGGAGRTISLYAPISGVLANFNLSVGSTVKAEQQLFTIINLSTVYAEAQVFDKDGHYIIEGAKFSVECANDNHKTSEVKLLSLAQEINSTNQSQRVLFELNNPDSDFKIGEFVNIRVFAKGSSNKIALPNAAFTEINGKPVVFIKDAAETYSLSYVQIGENNGTYTSIIKGVEEGERVVVNGSYQLKMIYLNQ